MIRVLPALFLMLASWLAHAASTVDSFKSSSRVIPQRLISQGTAVVAGIDLRQVLRKMDEADIRASDWVEHSEGKDVSGVLDLARNTAAWKRKNGRITITVNAKLWAQADPETRGVIALHEHLGSQGFNDQKYILSTGLWMLSTELSRKALESGERRDIEQGLLRLASSKGGSTFVGGGGDIVGVRKKMTLLKMHMGRMSHASSREERREVMSLIADDFNSFHEVSRGNGPGPRGDVQSSRENVTIVDVCEKTLAKSRSDLEQFHQIMIQDAGMKKRFPTTASYVKFCRGFLNGSIKLK